MRKIQKPTNALKGVFAAIAVAVAAGGSSPWWYKELFSKSSDPVTPATPEKPATQPREVASTETAVLPDLLSHVPIWEAIPKLKAAGFGLPAIDLKHDETFKVGDRLAYGGMVIGVSDVKGKILWAGQSYAANTHVRIKVQSDPSWNQAARIYTEPEEVNGLTELIRKKQAELEKAAKGAKHFNR